MTTDEQLRIRVVDKLTACLREAPQTMPQRASLAWSRRRGAYPTQAVKAKRELGARRRRSLDHEPNNIHRTLMRDQPRSDGPFVDAAWTAADEWLKNLPQCAAALGRVPAAAKTGTPHLFVHRRKRPLPCLTAPELFAGAEAGFIWERRAPRPEDDDHILSHTQSWQSAVAKGVRAIHLPEKFPRIANDLSRLWPQSGALDQYFEEKEFSSRTDREGFPPVIKEELLCMHVYSRLHRQPPCEQRPPKVPSLLR